MNIQGQTAVGIERCCGHTCFGILIEVDTQQLYWFDEREMRYEREEIELEKIWHPHEKQEFSNEILNLNSELDHPVLRIASERRSGTSSNWGEENVKCWVYTPQSKISPCSNFPIAQSYVDIILRGCVDISEGFALNFLETTDGWIDNIDCSVKNNFIWIDDREMPLYIRADMEWSNEKAALLDKLHKITHSHALDNRKSLKLLL